MLNLIEKIPDEDKIKLIKYISSYGAAESIYVGNEVWLGEWNKEKKTLYRLLGQNLIFDFPFNYEKPQSIIEDEVRKIFNIFWDEWFRKIIYDNKYYDSKINLYSIFSANFSLRNFINEKTSKDINITFPKDNKRSLRISAGAKPIRSLIKMLNYLEAEKIAPGILDAVEEFRVKLSMVTNEKIIKGTMHLSIHPLDFITISDNGYNWSSCMSWMKDGCYRQGTIEMMNSNCVIVAYFDTKTPFNFLKNGEECYWNSKRWRQLFYVTKDIIVGGKAYPYANNNMTITILNKLRELAIKNWHHTYEFGPELYRDMLHINGSYSMNRARHYMKNSPVKHNILFDSNAMYNDMINDSDRQYYCIRNKVKKTKIINYSGKAKCLCCNESLTVNSDYEEYNDRFDETGSVMCEKCTRLYSCQVCGKTNPQLYLVNEKYYCEECVLNKFRKCPCCNKIHFRAKNAHKIIRILSPCALYNEEHFFYSYDLCICSECVEKVIEENNLGKRVEEESGFGNISKITLTEEEAEIITKESCKDSSDFICHLKEEEREFIVQKYWFLKYHNLNSLLTDKDLPLLEEYKTIVKRVS